MTFPDYLQTQPLLRVAVMLVAGIIVGDGIMRSVPALPSWSEWIWLSIVALSFLLELAFKDRPYTQSGFLLAAIFFTGMAIADQADRKTAFPFQQQQYEDYEAVVTSEPQVKGKTLHCDLALTAINGRPITHAIHIKASFLRDTITNDWKYIQLGSGIRAQSIMEPLQDFHQGHFDYVRWLHAHGFRAQTFVYYSNWQPAKVNLKSLSLMSRMRLFAMQKRQILVHQLRLHNSKDAPSAVVAAMVLGDKHALSKELKNDYSISGASHILALSGLHLSIIYFVLTLITGIRKRRHWLPQAVILMAIWTYVMLVGMSASVVRSAVMLSIYSLCIVAGRDNASLNTLSLAAIVLTIANPLCVWDVGFQLSFMSVLAILIFYNPFYQLLSAVRTASWPIFIARPIHYLWSMVSVSLAAQIGTAPLVAYYFGRFPCYFLLSNFIVIPCATLIIYGAIVAFLTTLLPLVNGVILAILDRIATFLNTSMSLIASLPGASIEGIQLNGIETGCIYVLVGIAYTLALYLRKTKDLEKLDAFAKKRGQHA